jgi:hypothetical protein
LRIIFGPKRKNEGENYIMRSFTICTSRQIIFDDNINEDEMMKTCRTHGETRNAPNFFTGKREEFGELRRTRRAREWTLQNGVWQRIRSSGRLL